ncbi:FAD-dependent oxidoreductase [Pedobacter namyangjuensis]|uniref:FAD-dependent oxidoreductase n=1 Tax=Pedobacter namyangjuensis TaxID=600626 RepID=UPI000DE3A182|nr:FAD-dependent oxidoreductase [Pedobacter namyangjuensis]
MEKSNKTIPRDSCTISPWQTLKEPFVAIADGSKTETVYDVIIVGAGITGLTTALLLQQAGKRCVVVEAGKIGFGTTGGTSAHLNTFFDATYPEVERDFGKQAAKELAEAGKEARSIIASLAGEYGIDCELEYKDGYLFSETGKQTDQLEQILQASLRAGIAVGESQTNDVPVPFERAIRFSRQGQFHPLKYIQGLAGAFQKLGGEILEESFVGDHGQAEGNIDVHIEGRSLRGRNLVYATHIPPGITSFSFRCAPYRSYVLGIELKDDNYPSGLAYDMQEPYHYFRTHKIDGSKYLILGGADHKTGHGDPEQAFSDLESYARKYYGVKSIPFRWSSQYYVPVDGLPYIGLLNEQVYIATGFNGNGMMFGTIAAKIIADMVLGIQNRFERLFSPSRLKPVAGFSEFVKENADVAWRFVADRFGIQELEKLSQLSTGEGRIAEFDGKKLALYKDVNGKVTALNPICSHAGCTVIFNAAEKSWDCPCHGGRFDLSGKVVCGPPRTDLEKVEFKGNKS